MVLGKTLGGALRSLLARMKTGQLRLVDSLFAITSSLFCLSLLSVPAGGNELTEIFFYSVVTRSPVLFFAFSKNYCLQRRTPGYRKL